MKLGVGSCTKMVTFNILRWQLHLTFGSEVEVKLELVMRNFTSENAFSGKRLKMHENGEFYPCIEKWSKLQLKARLY